MNTKQTSKFNWPAVVIIGSSIPILLIIIGFIAAWIKEINTQDGIYDVTIMNAVFYGGLYFAIPCGLLNIIVGSFGRSRGLLKKKVAVTGISIGVLGILLGLVFWIYFIMLSSFVF